MRSRIIKLLILTSAPAVAAGALVLHKYPDAAGFFWVSAPQALCSNAAASVGGLGSQAAFKPSCMVNVLNRRVLLVAELPSPTGPLPVAVMIRLEFFSGLLTRDALKARPLVVEIQGGPGSPTLSPPLRGFDDFAGILDACRAAIVTPAYSGSFERSNYPESSHEDAEREVGWLVSTFMKGGNQVNIVAVSLGANILSSKSVQIPDGGHLLLVPAIESPNNIMDFFVTNPEYKFTLTNTYSSAYIKRNNILTLTSVPKFQFMKSYFGNDDRYLNESFVDRWRKKQNVAQGSRFYAVIGDRDERTGGMRYVKDLQDLGMTVEVVEGGHRAEEANRHRLDRALAWFEKEVCDTH